MDIDGDFEVGRDGKVRGRRGGSHRFGGRAFRGARRICREKVSSLFYMRQMYAFSVTYNQPEHMRFNWNPFKIWRIFNCLVHVEQVVGYHKRS